MSAMKIALVTGAGSGVGRATAVLLAEEDATVIVSDANAHAADRVASEILKDGLAAEPVGLDVADESAWGAAIEAILARHRRLDVLVNNAGVMGLPLARTVDGFETQMATNHLGHFALANLLLPRLTDRVVVVGSASHRSGDLDVDDLGWERRGYRPYAAYAASKLANLLFLAELQRRLTASGSTLRATGAHPGYTATAIQGGRPGASLEIAGERPGLECRVG